MSFKSKMKITSEKKDSGIVLALDFPYQNPEKPELLLEKAESVLDQVSPYISAVKVNHHLTLPLGVFGGVQKIIKKAQDCCLLTIMDCKANDIGATNQVIAEYYYKAGFDAIIANPFIGWEEGLKPIFETANRMQRGVILLTYMSHKGAGEGYGQTILDADTNIETKQYIAFARRAHRWKADGVVVGATVPEKIREIYEVLGNEVPIYSPGVGAQGGKGKDALTAGARYLIVGREITQAENPAKVAEKLSKLTRYG